MGSVGVFFTQTQLNQMYLHKKEGSRKLIYTRLN